MSADKKKKKKKKKKERKVLLYSINKDVVRFVLGLIFGLLTLFTLVSLISYLFTWAEDQSLLSNGDVFSNIITANNGGGKIGFMWSHLLVSKLFGIGAFVVPFFLGGISIYCFKIKQINLWRLFFLSLMGCIVTSMFFSYIFSFTKATSLFGEGAGGSYGYYINDWLCSMLGRIGAGCVVVFLLLLWFILLNDKIVSKITGFFNSLFKISEKAPLSGAEGEIEGSIEGGEETDEDEENDDDEEDEDDDNDDDEEEEDGDDGKEEDEDDGEKEEDEEDKDKKGSKKGDEGGLEHSDDEDTIPPIEIIQSDETDFSKALTDEEWRYRYDPRLSLNNYKFPPFTLLEEYKAQKFEVSRDELEKNNRKIVSTLRDYKINISRISARIGPTVTLYEIVPAPGVRVSQIKRLEEDIALSLAAKGVRVITLSGTNAIGIEVANEKPSIVSMRSVLEDPKFRNVKYDLPVALGLTISNEVMSFDLAKMPHLLIAGATGQGKSVGLNAIITSLLYKKHPAELKFVLVDPKKVELSLYGPIKDHYLAKLPEEEEAIITDTQKVIYTLKSLCKLMDRRYDLLKAASVRNIKEYNEKFLSRKLNPSKGHEFMPYIVVIIDEFADMLMTAGREIEEPIARLAQLARAIGIHLVIATQRPTTNIITGTIKANFPARIAFKVFSSIDSKTILDQTGANQLVGRGDMLIYTGTSEPVRVQCAFIDTPEVERITRFVHDQPGCGGAYLLPEYVPEDSNSSGWNSRGDNNERDDLFKEAARLIVREQQGSTSLIQRKMNLGYNRAGRIIDQLEDAGIVGPSEGSKARVVRITSLESLEQLLSNM